MTKKVRIENADMADFKVLVQVWEQASDGGPDAMVFERELPFPTSMADDIYLTSTRYVVVKEA